MISPTEQRSQGSVERSGDDYVVRFERRLDHPIDRVWLALTQPESIEKWLAAATTFELREGGTVELRWLNNEEDTGVRATISKLDPPHLLEWNAGEPLEHPAAACRWELRPDGSGCVLTFSSTMPADEVDRRAAADPEHWSPPSMLAGWHMHLGYLAQALDGNPVEWSVASNLEEWAELYALYGGKRG